MLLLFGGWHGYMAAPTIKIEEQIIVWQARLMEQSEQEKKRQDELEEMRRRNGQ